MWVLLNALCLSLCMRAALALPTDDQASPTTMASIEQEYSSLQTVFRRLINMVVTRNSAGLTPQLQRLLHSEMTPNQTQELVVDILNGVKEELQAAKVELAEEIKAAKAKGDEEAASLLTTEFDVLERVVKKTYIAVRMAQSVSPEILTAMTDKFKPLLAGILEANEKPIVEDGVQDVGGNEVVEESEMEGSDVDDAAKVEETKR